jgi:hypothetical protein
MFGLLQGDPVAKPVPNSGIISVGSARATLPYFQIRVPGKEQSRHGVIENKYPYFSSVFDLTCG